MNIKYLTILFSIFAFYSCNKPDAQNCIKSTGDLITETKNLPNFSTIDLYGKIDLYLINSDENRIEISAGENLIPKITSIITDSTLKIDNENKCNWVRSYKKGQIIVKLYFTQLNYIKINGENNVFSNNTDTLTFKNITIEVKSGISNINLIQKSDKTHLVIHDGSGEVFLKGKTNSLYVWNNGISLVDLRNLKTDYIYFVAKSQNKSFINCNNKLDVDLYENGDVYYYGNPLIINEKNFSNSAKLIKAD